MEHSPDSRDIFYHLNEFEYNALEWRRKFVEIGEVRIGPFEVAVFDSLRSPELDFLPSCPSANDLSSFAVIDFSRRTIFVPLVIARGRNNWDSTTPSSRINR